MNSENMSPLMFQESWASAVVDGEAFLSEQADLNDTVHEQLYYYTITRQVIRGDMVVARHARFETQRATWVEFWARVDKI